MKMNPIRILACSIATLGTLSASALAQDPTATPSASPSASPGVSPSDMPPPHHHPVPPVFKALDSDKDGIISATEIASAPAALKMLDANKDGQLSPGELRPKWAGQGGQVGEGDHQGQMDRAKMNRKAGGGEHRGPGGPEGPRGPHGRPPGPDPLVRALDSDDDGIISASEITNASTALKTLDKNGDGQITRDELRPQGPPPPPPAEDGTPDDAPMPPPSEQ